MNWNQNNFGRKNACVRVCVYVCVRVSAYEIGDTRKWCIDIDCVSVKTIENR